MTARVNWRAVRWMLALLLFIIAVGMLPTPAHAKHLSRHTVAVYLRSAAVRYHLSAAKTRWIVRKGLHIAWGESRYNTHTGSHAGCLGLYQFAHSWKHANRGWAPGHKHKDARRCGKCSAYRFVKVFKVGGKRAIKRHRRATW